MAKRKSSAPSNSNSNSKRNKTDDSETSEMLRRAMDMQAEFDQEDSGSESSDNDSEEQDATDSEDSQHQEHSETEPAVLPLPGTSKSAASRLESILRKTRALHPSAPSATLEQVQQTLRHLKSTIETLPSWPAAAPMEAAKKLSKKSGISVPWPTYLEPALKEVNWKVSFESPASVNVVGLWPCNMALKTKNSALEIELAVEMPTSIFQDKDLKDGRYFAKRAFYLSVIQSALHQDPSLQEFTLTRDHLDELRHFLLLQSPSYNIRVVPTISSDYFPAAKLTPNRNNLRPSQKSSSHQAVPTPLYNDSLLRDTLHLHSLTVFHRCSTASPYFGDAARLLQLWSRAHEWPSHVVDFLLMFMAYLVDVRRIMSTSAKGLFSSTLEWLVREEFDAVLGWKESVSSAYASSLSGRAFLHPSGRLDMLQGIHNATLELMKAQATQALQVLQRNTASDLDILFPASRSQHLPSEAVYDLSLTIALNSTQLGESLGHLDEQPDAFALPSTALHCSFLAVLRRALGTRVKAIHLTLLSTSSVAHLGLIYQSGEATRLVDHGPPASDEAGCRVFQQFWGDKSELRRFKDGKIEEVVVWEAPTVLSRFAVPEQIVRYILQHKFNVQSDQLKSHVSDLHQIVQEPVTWRQRLYQADPEVNGFSGIMKSFEELSTALRDLSDLPLHIKSIAPASDSLRYSSTFIPGGRKTKQYHHLPEQTSFVTAADVVITFEQSGKWPSDLQAIQKVKTAFLVQIGNLLQKVIPHAQCATAFNPQSSASSDNLALEVLMPSGFAFRLHIFHEPEIALLGEASFDDSSLTSALQCYRQRLVLRPRHHAAFVSLIHQYPALSGTTRLVKRWINSHLLTSHFSTEQIELLCAHVFLRGNPPASPVRGFVCVLHLISIWCWWSEPLLTPIFTASKREGSALDAASLGRGIDFPGDKAAAVQASFNAARQNDPAINAGAWFLATEEDPASRWWNWSKPNRMLAGRIKDLASASLASFGETLTPKTLFTPPVDVFDFALHLKSSKVPRQHQALSGPLSFTSKSSTSSSMRIPVSFDQVSDFVDACEAYVGDAAVLFFDRHGGTSVYGIFNPLLEKPRLWNGAIDFPARPAEDEQDVKERKKKGSLVTLDKHALIANLVRLGRGLVSSVQ